MGLWDRQDTVVLDRRQSLGGIPMLNRGVSVAERDAGDLTVTVPAPERRGFMRVLAPQMPERQIKLDMLGSYVLRQVNGTRSVLQIVNALAERFKLHRREAELSTSDFLKSLAKRGVVSIVIK